MTPWADDYPRRNRRVEASVVATIRDGNPPASERPLDRRVVSQLDEFAAKVQPAKGYMIEVSGHTDSTGGDAKNFHLSQQRAEAVVQYLAVQHKIPLRRFVTPMGYGKTEAVAENSTAAGRAQNRRVEVKMLTNRGLSQRTTTPTPAAPAVKP